MRNLDRIKEIKIEEEESELSKAALFTKSLHPSNEAAIVALLKRLDLLAQKVGMVTTQLLQEAENSATFKEEHEEAMAIAMRISFFKEQRK